MPKWIIPLIAGAIGLWLSWVFQAYIIGALGGKYDPQYFGQWGDTFGALNALFATLGFGAALCTLLIQQRQIAKDRFDGTFWELLKLFIETREKFRFRFTSDHQKARSPLDTEVASSLRSRSSTASGLAAFQAAWLEFKFWIPGDNASKDEIIEVYNKKIHGRYETTLGPYFRLLYTILSRIDKNTSLSDAERKQYGNLIRSQLTQYEVALIGLNGLSPISKDFDKFVKKYRILKYSTGSRRRILKKHYPLYTFQRRDLQT